MTKSNILVAFRGQFSGADAAAYAYSVSPAPLNLTPRSLQTRSYCLRSIEIHEPNPMQSQGREMHPHGLAGGIFTPVPNSESRPSHRSSAPVA